MVVNAKKLKQKLKHMLEWLEVRLDVGDDKRLVYEYGIEPQQRCAETRMPFFDPGRIYYYY